MTVETHPDFPSLRIVKHPLLQHKLTHLRNKRTSKKSFRELAEEITLLLAYEATKDLPMTTEEIETPVEPCEAPVIQGKKPVILPILRAGVGMVDAFLSLMPPAKVGHIGLFRNEETLEPESYYFKIPKKCKERHFFVVDPMLATGGSAIAAIDRLKEEGIKEITFVCIVSAPEGVAKVVKHHPDVTIFTASLDSHLNEHGYIVPGLGDAGDRLFGTH